MSTENVEQGEEEDLGAVHGRVTEDNMKWPFFTLST